MNMTTCNDDTGEWKAGRLKKRPDGKLSLAVGEPGKTEDVPVSAVCCFPWSMRREFISLRDEKGTERLMVERLDDLPGDERKLIEDELGRRLFVPRITKVESIVARSELFHWIVQTDAGRRSMLTARNEHPRVLPGGRLLIKDVGNDLYLVENLSRLDARSRRLLWVYTD